MIPGQGARILHGLGLKNQDRKQKPFCNKFNKDYKNGPHIKKKKECFFGPSYIEDKEMATHSSTLAWRIPRTEEPGGLQSIGSHAKSLTRLSVHLLVFLVNALDVYVCIVSCV